MNKKLYRLICLIFSTVFLLSAVLSSGCNDDVDDPKNPGGDSGSTTDREQVIKETDKLLVDAGTTEYEILLRSDYDISEGYAAEEFNRLLKIASGVELPIVTTADLTTTTKYVSIGETAMANEADIHPSLKDYTRNGFKIKSYKDGLIINAPQRSGLIYGVYRFFEKNCNYMYYNQDCMRIDHSTTINLKDFDFDDWPDFLNRDIYCYETISDPEYTMRLFSTGGQFSKWDSKYGEGSWWCKSLDDQSFITSLLPWGLYGEMKGKRGTGWLCRKSNEAGQDNYPQICYTEGLYSKDEWEKGDFSEENYDDGRHGMFWTLVYRLIYNHINVQKDKCVFLLGMADNAYWCPCDKCAEDMEKYQKSGVCVRFLNEVAKEVEKWRLENCPEREIYVSVFAYQGLTSAPTKKDSNGKIVPLDDSLYVEDNILLRYAPAMEYYLFPLMDEEHNPAAYEALTGWTTLAKHLSVWDYRISFYDAIFPFPNWMSGYENIQTYKRYGFLDVMYQGGSYGSGHHFLYMDNWVRARLSWDTTLDYDVLMDEFIDNFYGEAADIVREYKDYLTQHYMTYMLDLGRMAMPHYYPAVTSQYFPRGVINNIERLFGKMYEAIEVNKNTDPARYNMLKKHIDHDSLFYRYCQLNFYYDFYLTDEYSAMLKEYERIALLENFTDYGNKLTLDQLLSRWSEHI